MSDPATAAPRKRDSARTKAAILEAAKTAFATRGYAQTGIRDIAGRAGVNPALVLRYFGSKEGLFAAALGEALDTQILLAGGREHFGRHVARLLSEPGPDANVAAMMILAAADEAARAIATRLTEETTLRALAQWLGAPDAVARAARITVLCTGFVVYRKLLPIAPLASDLDEGTVEWFANALQAIVDEPGADCKHVLT